MQPQTVTHRFITRTFDKFNDSTVTELKWPGKFTSKFYNDPIEGCDLTLTMRHIQMPTVDALAIDYIYRAADWMFLRNGEMVINLDDRENISLQPTEAATNVKEGGWITERGYYTITKEQLKKIGDAQTVAIKISGSSTFRIIDAKTKRGTDPLIAPDEKFLFMCRAFYAGMYNDVTYEPGLEKIIPVGKEKRGKFSAPIMVIMVIGTILPFALLFYGGIKPFAIYFVTYVLFVIGFLAVARMRKVKKMKLQQAQ